MKTRNKKIISVILALTMILSMAGAALAAGEYDTAGAVSFKFADSGITATGGTDGYSIDGTALTITGAGTYIVSGSCSDGSIKIKKGVTDVTLVLNGLTLTSSDTAPIVCAKSSQVNIVAASGTVNNLTDSAKNNDETYTDNTNAENAVIKAKDGSQVTISGSGTIKITANGKNGIKSGETTDTEGEAFLTIKDVTLNITSSANDGINAGSTLNILSGNITVNAADDGVKSDYTLNIGSEGTNGPTILVESSVEAIEGAVINIYSGDIEAHASEDGINAANSDLGNYDFQLNIYGGKVYVDAATGDGLDSNGTVNLAGGTIEVYSSSGGDNQPLDGERGVTIGDATVLAVGSAGMGVNISGTAVTFGSGGMMGGGGHMGGGRMGGMNGGMGGMMNGTGGDITGLASESADLTVDTVSSATEYAKGGMMGGFPNGQQNGDGQQPAMPDDGNMGGFPDMGNGGSSVSIAAGDTITILDESGNTIYTAKAVRSAGYVLFSSPELTSGSTYTLSINGAETATATASESVSGGMGGGGHMGGGQRPTQPTPPDGTQPTPPDGTQPTPPQDGQQPR